MQDSPGGARRIEGKTPTPSLSLLDQRGLVVQEGEDALQQRVEVDAFRHLLSASLDRTFQAISGLTGWRSLTYGRRQPMRQLHTLQALAVAYQRSDDVSLDEFERIVL
jgi:hypothetical protein